jgi:hypothetical protein
MKKPAPHPTSPDVRWGEEFTCVMLYSMKMISPCRMPVLLSVGSPGYRIRRVTVSPSLIVLLRLASVVPSSS